MSALVTLIASYGLALVFANVLAEQLGLPIPALPTLVVAGALAAEGKFSAPQALLAAVTASVIADLTWYELGRRQGSRILKTLCRISLSPDICVRQTETYFERWGLPSLLVAKFVPGFSTVAPPLAGALRSSRTAFLLFDAGGAFLWAGTGVALGMLFHRAIDRALEKLASVGAFSLVLLAAALAVFIAVKSWRRRRFFEALRAARISAGDLRRLMDDGKSPIVLDVRSSSALKADPRRVPGAEMFAISEVDQRVAALPRDREIILYCT
jgi:membrane protein DedA with SNARE-associated domain